MEPKIDQTSPETATTDTKIKVTAVPLSRDQWRVLGLLSVCHGPLDAHPIAHRLAIHLEPLLRILQQLMERQLITSSEDGYKITRSGYQEIFGDRPKPGKKRSYGGRLSPMAKLIGVAFAVPFWAGVGWTLGTFVAIRWDDFIIKLLSW